MKFVVIVQNENKSRVFGPYRSFLAADRNARTWRGITVPLEDKDSADNPWDADWEPPQSQK